ncbi:MAG: N-acetylglucosaminyl-diphospho-decaprenol L-rhamnosyltransferase [Pseudonocardiales bacterium]|jgi:N-acetylglucosaminyl-diphospho-decaprenol L-rhamnosyltransferase|nr:N-acetylglucosaminyl-diphospho-decaprenol L-rhamnosyltransferase [Pseudonocardiales bacterium]
MTAAEPLAVVVVTYSPGEALNTFLDTLVVATNQPLDIVLADNGSEDGSIEAAAARPGVRLLHTGGNLGYGRAANLGVRETTAELVVVANPDIEWEPGSLDALVAAAGRWPQGGAFGPLIHTPDGAIYPSARALPSLGRGIGHALFGWWWPSNPWTAAYRVETEPPRERTAGWVSGSCVLLRRDAFDEVGGFDPGYFMYFEDLDLGDRLGKGGWQNVYVPSAVVSHTGGHATSKQAARMTAEHHRSAWRYLSGRYRGWRWLPVRLMLHAGLRARSGVARRVPRVAAGAEAQRHES